ncbi:hypothetical protein ACTXT7_007132 [Hymenolepis weldensis]
MVDFTLVNSPQSSFNEQKYQLITLASTHASTGDLLDKRPQSTHPPHLALSPLPRLILKRKHRNWNVSKPQVQMDISTALMYTPNEEHIRQFYCFKFIKKIRQAQQQQKHSNTLMDMML